MKQIKIKRKSIFLLLGVLLTVKKLKGLEFQIFVRKNLEKIQDVLNPIRETMKSFGVDSEEEFKKAISDPEYGEVYLAFEEEETLNLYTIKKKHIPEDIDGIALDNIWPFIEFENDEK